MRYVAIVMSITACVPLVSAQTPEWERMHVDSSDTHFQAVAVHPSQPTRVFVATAHTLHESVDGGATWRTHFRVPSGTQITAIAVSASEHPTVLLATDHGLYASFHHAEEWVLAFRGIGGGSAHCTHVAFHPRREGTVLLATDDGLLMSTDAGRHWRTLSTPRNARPIVHFAFDPTDPERVFLVSTHAVFIGNLVSGQWQQRLSLLASDVNQPQPEEPGATEPTESEETFQQLSAIAIDPQQPSTMYVAGSTGLLKSDDGGAHWQPVTRVGLGTPAITRLIPYAHSPLVLYAATTHGVARYEPLIARWTMITVGLPATLVHDLAAAPQMVWAATDHGLYRYQLAPGPMEESASPSPHELLSNFVHEPTIGQVHEAAIRYADVHPRKIKAWQQQARLKALVPKLGVTSGTNLTDFRHWDTGPNPDVLQRGKRDLDWNANISWELGNLIWSDDQTSIDARSRLMVQLRDDIVGEVTQAYFERRRLQVLLLTTPPEDQQMLLDHELRVQELTATLDGLTGGYFSRQMRITENP